MANKREYSVEYIIETFNSINCINSRLSSLGERRITYPEIISENLPVLFFQGKYLRTKKPVPGYGKSDLIDLEEKVPVQVKSCTTKENDCSSFRPNTTQAGYTVFIEFLSPLENGNFKIFRIENKDIEGIKVNSKQTVLDQKREGRRPRLSLKKYIKDNNIQPFFQGAIQDLLHKEERKL